MRLVTLSLVAAAGLVSPGLAEERVTPLPEIVIGGPLVKPEERATGRPELVIGGGAAANTRGKPDRCVEVEIGSSRSMDCLNQKLKREVDRVNPVMKLPPIDARSSDIKTGVVNIPGVQQQFGRNFGVSVIPYRPPSPVFSSPHR